MSNLRGWRTYILFAATLALSVASALGWGSLSDADTGTIAEIVEIITNPVTLSALALIMRSITRTPPASPIA